MGLVIEAATQVGVIGGGASVPTAVEKRIDRPRLVSLRRHNKLPPEQPTAFAVPRELADAVAELTVSHG